MRCRCFVNDQDLYKGLIRVHILHHASEKAVFGLWFIEELAHHGYKLSPGTLYPILHGMEENGYLRSSAQLMTPVAPRLSGNAEGEEGSCRCKRKSERALW